MADKKETFGPIVTMAALIGCCLLLTTILTGGAITLAGNHLNNSLIIAVGIGLMVVALVAFILTRRRGERNGKKENFEKESKGQSS